MRFDHRVAGAFKHAGTFNNNVCTMMAGIAALTKIFTPEVADAFAASCEKFRISLNEAMDTKGVPLRFTGLGSLIAIHFSRNPINRPADIPSVSKVLGQLFHMENILHSILLIARGDIFISLAVTKDQLRALTETILAFVEDYRPLIEREVGTH